MYELLVVTTGLSCLAAILIGSQHFRDTFHPMVYLGALLGVLYVGYPAYMLLEGKLWRYFDDESLFRIQSIYLTGVWAMLTGVWKGSGPALKARSTPPIADDLGSVLDKERAHRLRVAAIVVGLLGFCTFVYTVISVGGMEAAFGKGYGGGWSDSGYVRETFHLTIPALLWLMVVFRSQRPTLPDWGFVLVIASPFLVQGILGARRGPTFMAVVALGVGWYLMRRKRPRLVTVLTAGALLGGMLLLLVTNRGEIHLGSDLELRNAPLDYIKASTGNEYLYGAAVMLHAEDQGEILWGRRYAQVFLVRPIPRAWWPSKYDDASRVLGVPSVESGNGGLPTAELLWTVGWPGANGSATGIVADLWVEFWWFGLVALFGIGWIYGQMWRRGVTRGGAWIPAFGTMTALSIYLVMQGIEAMGFRALLMLAGSSLIWAIGRYSGNTRPIADNGYRPFSASEPTNTVRKRSSSLSSL